MNVNGRIKYGLFFLAICAIVLLILAACSGGTDTGDHTATSSVTFRVIWDRPDSHQPASLTDCEDVDTVNAAVYSAEGVLLGTGGPWDCIAGSGDISNIPANYFAFIGVAGYDLNGVVLYYGQNESPVFLDPGTVVDAGVIIAGTFVPTPLSPADAAWVARSALELQWNRLPGASGYLVTIASDSMFSDTAIFNQIVIDDGDTTSVRPDVSGLNDDTNYFWRVQGIDDTDSLGNPSTPRQFSLLTLTITNVTLIDNGAVVPNSTTTTVSFAYSTVTSTQQRDGATIGQWSVEMDTLDYFDLQDLVQSNELTTQGDLVLPDGYPACTGWAGMHISITEADGAVHEFNIGGSIGCYRDTLWPPGVLALVTRQEELVTTYQP